MKIFYYFHAVYCIIRRFVVSLISIAIRKRQGAGKLMDEVIKLRYCVIKRELFDKYYSFLNSEQRQSVYTVQGPLLILAGAGSGKTTVLVNRLAYLVRYGNAYKSSVVPDNIDEAFLKEAEKAKSLDREALGEFLCRFAVTPPPAWTVMAITFTNKAAREIKARIGSIFGEDDSAANDIWSGTFHSVCLRMLRKYADRAGYASGFGICDTDDAKKLCRDCMKQLNIDTKQLEIKTVLAMISRTKERLLTPDDYTAEAGSDMRAKQVAKIYDLYQKRLHDSNIMDFDDIIMQTVKLLVECEDVREYYQNKFRYISVDEYQDTNKAQLMLVTVLTGRWRNIMVVGDDDQSIYKFRGATIENILSFDKTFPDAVTVKLEQNYRSTQTILDAANSVIAKNKERKGKKLWTDGEKGELITVAETETQLDEARYISDKIEESVGSGDMSYRDFAVLYRTNAQSRSIEQAFAKGGLPYRLLGGQRFFDRMEIRDIIAYAALVNNPRDDVRMERILNVPKRGIGASSVEKAKLIAYDEGVPLLEIATHSDEYKAIPAQAAKGMKAFAELISELRDYGNNAGVSALLDRIADKSGYREMIVAMGPAEEDRLDNIGELVSAAAQYEKDADEPSLSEFLEDVALVSDVDKYDEEADAVVLMTIHSAKGLEFPVVFLPGMEEGLFPGMQSIMNPSEIEEERRLAYVAITRAKRKLYILHTHQRMLNGSTQYNPPSRFVGEISPWLIEKVSERSEDYTSTGARGSFGEYSAPKKSNVYNSYGDNYHYGMGEDRAAYSGDVDGWTKRGSMYQPRKKPDTDIFKKAAPKGSTAMFEAGDTVRHITFGEGQILSVRPMGGDVMYEIAFEKVGTKKLMQTYAKLTKI